MQYEVVDLLRDNDRIRGVRVRTPDRLVDVQADLVVGCDGRHSVTRKAADLPLLEFGVPIDVLWFRISRGPGDPEQLLGNFNYGRALVLIDRGDYFQAGLLIRKNSFEDIQKSGLESFRKIIVQIAPYLQDRVDELKHWDQIKLLSVQLNRLQRWYRPGLLCIGDAAHAMSPAGGVGINLAIQDAVATANLLADALREDQVTEELLAQVQRRREFPTRVIQFLQANAHRLFDRMFRNPGPVKAPWQLRVVVRIPGLSYVTARIVGMGVRPEHVRGATRCNSSRLAKIAVGLGVAAGFLSVWSMRRGRRHAA